MENNDIVTTLISTMNAKHPLIKSMNVKHPYVVINQNDDINKRVEKNDTIWIDIVERGLSKSRNLAISESKGFISMIADDDIEFVENYQDIIIDSFKENPETDIIAFMVDGKNGKFKDYPNSKKAISYISSMKISSVQIAFRTNSIRDQIHFDERFGAGAQFSMGEENIFLFDCLKRGLKIKFEPVKIANLNLGDSTWFKGYNQKYLIDRGASFYRMTKMFYPLLILQFSIRKRKLFKKERINIFKMITLMYSGKKMYLDGM